MTLEEKEKLKKEMEKERKLIRMIIRETDIPKRHAIDIVLWTDSRKITQEVIDFMEEKLKRGEIVKEIEIMDYIYDLITAMDKE